MKTPKSITPKKWAALRLLVLLFIIHPGMVFSQTHIRLENEAYHQARDSWYRSFFMDINNREVSGDQIWNTWEKKYKQEDLQKKARFEDDSRWQFVGPTINEHGLGRVNVISFHPSNPDEYWIGAASGGAWKTTNNGLSWTCMTDDILVQTVSDIAINPLNPNTIYLATGDRDQTSYGGIGLLKSIDGGLTWEKTGYNYPDNNSRFRVVNRVLIDPRDTSTILIAAINGLFKSTDGGQTWQKNSLSSYNHIDMEYHPTNPDIVYAVNAGKFYKSTDAGSSWKLNWEFTKAGRADIEVSLADPELVFVLTTSLDFDNYGGMDGVYLSGDQGKSFSVRLKTAPPSEFCKGNLFNLSASTNPDYAGGCKGQGYYDMDLAVSPTQANLVLVGAYHTYISKDTGTAFTKLSQTGSTSSTRHIPSTHADRHFLAFHPLRPDVIFECNDGGVYRFDTPTKATSIFNGLGITQYYRNAVHGEAQFILGGAQDNGTHYVSNDTAKNVGGADGMECHIDPFDSNTYYTSYQFGKFFRTSVQHGNDYLNKNIKNRTRGAWLCPMEISTLLPGTIAIGLSEVYYSRNYGDSFSNVTRGITNSQTLRRIRFASKDSNRMYIVTNNDILHYTDNLSLNKPVTFQEIKHPGGNMSDLLVDYFDNGILYACFSQYGGPKFAVWDGLKWEVRNEGLPDAAYSCITQDTTNGTLYIGSNFGVFYYDTLSKSWQSFQNGLPHCLISDLGINYARRWISASSYGRGLWKSPLQDMTKRDTISTNVTQISPETSMHLYPNPVHDVAIISVNKPQQMQVLDVQGKEVLKMYIKSSGFLSVQDFKPGIYFIRNEQNQTLRFVKL